MTTGRRCAGFAAVTVLAAGTWAALSPAGRGEGPPSGKPAAPKGGEGAAGEVVRQKVPEDAVTAIENAETLTLYSLDPKAPGPDDKRDTFYDWPVLGRADVADPAVRKRLVAALWNGVVENDGRIGGCFNPRHGVRATHKGKTVDFIICFECLTVRVTDGKRRGTFLTTDSPQPTFDKALTDLKLPLAPKAGVR